MRKKRFFGILLMFALVLVLMPAMRQSAYAAAIHTHDDNINFQPWTSNNSLPTSGNYYLTADVTVGTTTEVSDTLNLCLSGKRITYNGSTGSVFSVFENKTLNLYDCSAQSTGTITGGKGRPNHAGEFAGGNIYINGGTFNMYGGTITGGSATQGGGVFAHGTFNMYGGLITGNTATAYAGGVFISGGSWTHTMSSGKITNNTARDGGGVFIGNSGIFTMSGGEISVNDSNGLGGGVGMNTGSFTMSAGEIKNNTAIQGGGVGVTDTGGQGGASFTLEDGKITGNTGTYNGGGVYVYRNGSFVMQGGEISGNTSPEKSGENQYRYGGGGVAVFNGGSFTMSAGEIKNNTAQNGGGVYTSSVEDDRMTTLIEGGKITDNSAHNAGGGIYAIGNVEVTISDGEIARNSAQTCGGIWLTHRSNKHATAHIAGGELHHNTSNTEAAAIGCSEDQNTYELSGAPKIYGNTFGTDQNATVRNLYVRANTTIPVVDNLAAGAEIGVTTETKPSASTPAVVFTSGLSGKLPAGKTVSDIFTSDDTDYYVSQTSDNEAELKQLVKYPLWVGGTQVTSANAGNIDGNNKASYDAASRTLTLNGYSYSGQGYNYSGSYYAGIYYNGADALTVSLSGENSVTQTKGWGDPGDCPIVIDSTAALTVAGSGSLTARQGDKWNYGPAILSSGPVTLSGGTVNAVGAYYNGIKAPSVTVKSTVTAVDVKGTGDSAKAVDGTLINEIAGIGYNQWNQPTKIEANNTGATLTYQHVVFPIAQYTLRFDANGGGGSMDDVTVEEGESYTLPDCGFDPPTDKKFNWWDVHGMDLIGIPGTPAVIASNCADENGVVSIKAIWIDADKAPAATVTTAPGAIDQTYSGQGQTLVTAGEAEGGTMQYALGTATEATQPYTTSIPTATDAGTYYVWYKVVGDANHKDSTPAFVEVRIATATVTLTYDANGGFNAPAAQTGRNDSLMISRTIPTMYTGDSFRVTLDYNDGSGSKSIISTLHRYYYTFTGWNTEPDGSGTSYQPGDAYTGVDSVTLYAQWRAGGEASAPVQLPTPKRDGYDFVGWGKNADAETGVAGRYVPISDVTLYAVWTLKQYTLTFDTDGGSEIAPVTGVSGTEIPAPADPEKFGFIFAGWDREIPATMPNEDITIKALWKPTQFGTADFTLPDALTEIEEEAFEGAAVMAVYVPDTVETIGANAFKDCELLWKIRLPQDCEIDETAFSGCTAFLVYAPAGGTVEAFCAEQESIIFVPEVEE